MQKTYLRSVLFLFCFPLFKTVTPNYCDGYFVVSWICLVKIRTYPCVSHSHLQCVTEPWGPRHSFPWTWTTHGLHISSCCSWFINVSQAVQGWLLSKVISWGHQQGCAVMQGLLDDPNTWMWEQSLGSQCFWVALGSHCKPILAGLHHRFLWCWLQCCLPVYQVTAGIISFQDLEYWMIWGFFILPPKKKGDEKSDMFRLGKEFLDWYICFKECPMHLRHH